MAKKRRPTDVPPTPTDGHVNPILSLRPEPELRAAIAELAMREDRSLAYMSRRLLIEALRARGLWSQE